MPVDNTEDIIAQMGFEKELDLLRTRITETINQSSEEMREPLEWQFQGKSKYFRPFTVFSCYSGLFEGPIPPSVIQSALVVEMFHNVSLIIDDIVDESSDRRGKATLHHRFGNLPALMVAGYITADGFRIMCDDPYAIQLFSELMKRLGVAECMQWRLRRHPLGVEDWRLIAGEDTGSMFEICACVGTRSEILRRFGRLLGMIYHGCDDVGDVSGTEALGGGGDEDIRDGILTLPAALAIRDPEIQTLFCKPNPTEQDLSRLTQAFKAKLPEAEQQLDKIADEAREEAALFASNPEPLLALVDHTRQLSKR